MRQTPDFWCRCNWMVWLAPGSVRCAPLKTRSRTELNSSLYFLTSRSRRSSFCQIHSRNRSLIFCCFSRAASVEFGLTTCLSFVAVPHLVVNGRRPQIQRILNQFQSRGAIRPPIGRVGNRTFRHVTGLHRPSAELRREPNGHVLRAEQFLGERFNILHRNPARAQPRINLGGRQIFRLNRFQRLDIFVKAGFVEAGDFGGLKFFADIAGKIMVFRFPFARLRIEKQDALQFGQKFLCRTGNKRPCVPNPRGLFHSAK
jgi:hypothetical protein